MLKKSSAETGSPSRERHLRLDTPVQYLKGVGPRRAALLKSVSVQTTEDLLNYIPRRYLDRSTVTPISQLKPQQSATVVGRVETAGFQRGRKQRFTVILSDRTGYLNCTWFHGLEYLPKRFQTGDTVVVSGTVTLYHGKQMTHPEFEILSGEDDELIHTGRVVPLYPSTAELKKARLDSRGLRRIIKFALDNLEASIPEVLPPAVRSSHQLLTRQSALENIHFPETMQKAREARRRLAFDELFFMELSLALRRNRRLEKADGIVFPRANGLIRRLLDELSFELTAAQKRILHEIRADMKRKEQMNRLLQGDVGSGKTVVALIAMLIAVQNDFQAALMAPTEILAEQHYLTLRPLLDKLGVHANLLLGGMRKSVREKTLKAIETGRAGIVIGTHALIQEDVSFRRLGLVVIDEQHRFGVIQRAALRDKGVHPDVLVMTATPIPRSLSMTIYGDLDVSILGEMPPGRRPIKTLWHGDRQRERTYRFLDDQMERGRQVYVVCPLVEQSEKLDLKAAEDMAERLGGKIFPHRTVDLLHGRLPSREKEKRMRAFARGRTDLLVCTTVVEVGVDVPNATVMLVEHAERYGLAQLHQLRGRVGRGHEQSFCLLMASYPLSDEAKLRLKTLCRTNDGFEIAEVDLRMRGPGEIFGTRQHGLPELKVADLVDDVDLLRQARREAFDIVEKDPQLSHPQHEDLKDILQTSYGYRMELAEVG
jgi:ATP-dependent DNA helicase RecG